MKLLFQLYLPISLLIAPVYTRNPKVKTQFTNIERSTVNGSCVVEAGTVPSWVKGYFIRQACAAFGQTGQPKIGKLTNKITHLFDCIPAGTSFRIKDGEVRNYNRYYDTVTHDIWKSYNYDMSKSGVWFGTAYSNIDFDQQQKHEVNYTFADKVGSVPHVTWWAHYDTRKVTAIPEYPFALEVDIRTMEAVGSYPFEDDNLGLPQGAFPISMPAHEQEEDDGTLWSTTSVGRPTGAFSIDLRQAVFTVKDSYREVVAEYKWSDVDLTACIDGGDYPSMDQVGGYMHSLAITESYVVLPVTSYIMDPCTQFAYRKKGPGYLTNYRWRPDVNSKFLILRKADNNFVARIDVPAMFVTHQLNSYEKDGKLYLDMMVYNDSSVYTYLTYIENLLNEEPWLTDLTRFVIDTTSWTLVERKMLRENGPHSVEFSTVNSAYNSKPYKYSYMIKRPYASNSGISKLNVDTGETLEYSAPDGLFPSEPIFVPSPNAKEEDDGVVLVQGVDANQKKGFLVILDGKTMQQLSWVTAPDLALSGLHTKFYSDDFVDGKPMPNRRIVTYTSSATRCCTTVLNVLFLVLVWITG